MEVVSVGGGGAGKDVGVNGKVTIGRIARRRQLPHAQPQHVSVCAYTTPHRGAYLLNRGCCASFRTVPAAHSRVLYLKAVVKVVDKKSRATT